MSILKLNSEQAVETTAIRLVEFFETPEDLKITLSDDTVLKIHGTEAFTAADRLDRARDEEKLSYLVCRKPVESNRIRTH